MGKKKIKGVEVKQGQEFQIKFRPGIGEDHERARDRLLELLGAIAARGRYRFELVKPGCDWTRRGERYDTLPDLGLFRAQGVSLATETRPGIETKLKCKLHSLVPGLLYGRPRKAWCWPESKIDGVTRKFKLEQDIHFNNTKFCATGYMTLPGDGYGFHRVEDFRRYFPRLSGLRGVKKKLPLVKVKDWDEFVHDGMEFEIAGAKVRGALVTRRNRADGSWDETEFSFKLDQPGDGCQWLSPRAGWNGGGLCRLAEIYRELSGVSSVFIASPSIFYFADPVKSREIVLA